MTTTYTSPVTPTASYSRHQYAPPTYQSTTRASQFRLPLFLRRLFKPSQLDLESAVYEMTHLLYSPKSVFRNIYLQKASRGSSSTTSGGSWHRSDPTFTLLLAGFMVLASLAWSLAYTPSIRSVLGLMGMFVFVHLLGGTLVVSALFYGLFTRVLRRGVNTRGAGGRRVGLYGPVGSRGGATNELEFGYCYDVVIRAFFPVYVFLYVVQFILLPVIDHKNWGSVVLANTIYLVTAGYWFLIVFLGFNQVQGLAGAKVLLAPIIGAGVLWGLLTVLKINLERVGVPWLFWGVGVPG